jgi:hypothetical protein
MAGCSFFKKASNLPSSVLHPLHTEPTGSVVLPPIVFGNICSTRSILLYPVVGLPHHMQVRSDFSLWLKKTRSVLTDSLGLFSFRVLGSKGMTVNVAANQLGY